MIAFNPSDPFPLLLPGSGSYAAAQAHSEIVDRWLGMDIAGTEQKIALAQKQYPDQQLWVGLPPQTLQTPYTEIRTLLASLTPFADSRLVDLGAGYGRIGFVLGRHYPKVAFHGYEFVRERVAEGHRALERSGFASARLETADLMDPCFKPSDADYYFLYDFGSRAAIEKSLGDLREIASKRAITVIGRGRASRDAIEQRHPWLSQVLPPRHFSHYSIYRSA